MKTPEDELKRLMEKMKLNQTSLAPFLEISRGRMSEVMTGKKRLPINGIRCAVELGADPAIMLKPFKCELAH